VGGGSAPPPVIKYFNNIYISQRINASNFNIPLPERTPI
jgi:hypothetical protein